LRVAWPAIAFLLFMIPLPYRVETALCQPLQRLMSETSAMVLQMLGRPAIADGNVILMNGLRLEVVAACSGLGTLVVFFALATGLILLREPPAIDRIVLLVSAAPIALLANVAR